MGAGVADVERRELGLPDPAATAALARRIAGLASAGDVIGLGGDLGVGKTTFARFFIAALGGDDEVPSPTFSLVQIYPLETATVWHFDLFRLRRPEDAYELGVEDAFADGISLIEWPDRLGPLLPRDRLDIILALAERPRARRVRLEARGGWRQRIDEAAGNG